MKIFGSAFFFDQNTRFVAQKIATVERGQLIAWYSNVHTFAKIAEREGEPEQRGGWYCVAGAKKQAKQPCQRTWTRGRETHGRAIALHAL